VRRHERAPNPGEKIREIISGTQLYVPIPICIRASRTAGGPWETKQLGLFIQRANDLTTRACIHDVFHPFFLDLNAKRMA
jgi:hypothetical protein